MYLHKELETLTRPEIEKLQLERLQKTVRHCMNSPFYKQRFAENHLSPEDIRSLDDLQKIPFTTKQDLRDTYPFGLASVPLEKTVRLHSSSGTTGNPTVILHYLVHTGCVTGNGVQGGGPEIGDEFQLEFGVSGSGRYSQHSQPFSTILKAQPAGEHSIAGRVLGNISRT